jgi:hypothetical protein
LSVELRDLSKKEKKRETKELTLTPVINEKTTLYVNPKLPTRELVSQNNFRDRLIKGYVQKDAMEKALDLRHLE